MMRAAYLGAGSSLLLLILLCLAWETVLAPLRPGGSWLMLKTLPLLVPVFGVLRERLYTFRWTSMLSLAYFTEGVVRAWSDAGLSRALAVTEIVLSVVLFGSCLAYVRLRLRAAA
ncbi:MAG: DUF2069 domain-containing protein [Betaproteobacteria bacterium]|nr:DUF2069 domain-containing protein [Betaproteobacteria bacterium]